MIRSIGVLFVMSSCSCSEPQLRPGEVSSATGDSAPGQVDITTGPTRHSANTPSVVSVDRSRPKAATVPAPVSSPCPSDMVRIGRFCIDRYEAHLRVITPKGLGKVHPHYERPASGTSYVAVSKAGVFPQGYISRVEALAACREAGKRLCTRGEWMLACRGTKAIPKPNGERPCNNGKAHLLTQMFGGGYDYKAHFNNPKLNQTPGFLAKTGAFGQCKSKLGVHDMVGNLHEWVSDTVTRRFLTNFKAEVPRGYQHIQIGNGIFMGGFYSTTSELGPGCLFTTVAHDARYHDYTTGFRCCRAASPTTSGT